MKFIDLCAGIGGFRLAFEKQGAQCILTCEIDKFAKKTYLENFEENCFVNDITHINEKDIPHFDILCAGFPCQAFSKAGKQQGFLDTRGTIFFNIERILKHNRPDVFLLENVKNLKSHDKGKTYKTIQQSLENLNYFYQDFLFNAKYFVPQKRERIYILGINKEKYNIKDFALLTSMIEAAYEDKKLNTPTFKDILEKGNEKYTLSDKLWSFLQNHANYHQTKGNGFGFGLMTNKDVSSRTLTARYYKDGSEILVEQKNKNPRKLSPRECARLMGYPDTFKIPVSNTQAYKQFGNSVVVPIISIFAQSISNFLISSEKNSF